MRFASVRAHPFGPFRDETLALSAGMNVVYGPNEAGKSTWQAALFAGFCGMRRGPGAGSVAERRLRSRHRPWSGGSAWAVSTLVELEDGRRVELSRDLADRADCRVSDADRAGRDYRAEILHDGAPDGSRWLGLNRRSFLAVSFVRQAQVLGLVDDAAALQEDLQRAAATAEDSETAAGARERLTRYRRERIGSAQSRTRPLPVARDEAERARDAVERARRAQANHRQAAVRVERLDREAAHWTERVAADRAVLAEREAAEAERRAARAAELSARFPDGPPHASGTDGVAEQVAAALATWRARPDSRPPSGPAVEELEQELARASSRADGWSRSGRRPRWAAYVGAAVGAAVTAAAVALLLAGFPLAGSLAAGVGLIGLIWSWMGTRRLGKAWSTGHRSASEAWRTRMLERIAHRREMDARHAIDVDRCRRAAEAVRGAAARAGVAATGPASQVEGLAEWQRRRRAGPSGVEPRDAEWNLLQRLLGGRSLADLEAEARRRRAEAGARAAGVGTEALEAARVAGATPERLAEGERGAGAARAAAATERGRLEQLVADLPCLVDAEEELAAAARELERLERLDHTLATAIGFLERAEERVYRDVAPALRAMVRDWLPRVTGGRYADCKVDPQSLRVEVRAEGGAWRRAELLSQGTAEQVYLLLRLALARHLAAPGEVCPLILDDVVAASDARRKRAVLDALHAISASAQVILFTHEDDVRTWARERLNEPRDRLTTLPPAAVARRREGEEVQP